MELDTNWCFCGKQIFGPSDSLYCSQECANADALNAFPPSVPSSPLISYSSPNPSLLLSTSPSLSSSPSPSSSTTSSFSSPTFECITTSPSLAPPALTIMRPSSRISPPNFSLGQACVPNGAKLATTGYSMAKMCMESLQLQQQQGKRLFFF
ncbi:uncharacterized protein VTP21DRAFT_1144 [Calcarisporiella thermophila]|uniref:uncharacterized protein n=1 Tax=Calcarisporiella thermophila TaxID=911321 RepID=UPI0037440BA5